MSTDESGATGGPAPAEGEQPDLTLRPATGRDVPALARLHVAARQAAVPQMPPSVHTAAETHAWLSRQLGEREIWVAERAGVILGYLSLDQGWLDSLYVRPDLTGQGIGSVLLDLAKALRPAGLGLWVFQSNVRAQRFYRRHGFTEVERTDGADNEERAPDMRMTWPTR
jgi:ribosomal protein S18 acetylase RimI-like enzyme